MLKRIRARCVVRARRMRQNHGQFSDTSDLYFFAGAMAVLDCLRDDAAAALCDEWLRDFSATRSPTNQSPEASAARERERRSADEFETFTARLAHDDNAAALGDLGSELLP